MRPDGKVGAPKESAPNRGGAGGPASTFRLGALGIRFKLQIAFGAVAAMTVVAAGIAIMSFSATESGLQNVAGSDVPVMTAALRLSATSGEISAAASAFVSARTADEPPATSAV